MPDDIDPLTEPDVDVTKHRPPLQAHRPRLDQSATISPGGTPEMAERHRIAWVRISELVNSSSGHLVGRGLDLQSAVQRRLSVSPRRSEKPRRLAPLSAFGVRTETPSTHTIGRG